MTPEQKRRAVEAMQDWEYRQRLEESGFDDIEPAENQELLKGPSTINLFSFAQKAHRHQGLGNKIPHNRQFDEVAGDQPELQALSHSVKVRYYSHAEEIAVQAIREGYFGHEVCFTWWLHSQGKGERVICDLLDMPRSRVRKHLKLLRHNIIFRLDNEASD